MAFLLAFFKNEIFLINSIPKDSKTEDAYFTSKKEW